MSEYYDSFCRLILVLFLVIMIHLMPTRLDLVVGIYHVLMVIYELIYPRLHLTMLGNTYFHVMFTFMVCICMHVESPWSNVRNIPTQYPQFHVSSLSRGLCFESHLVYSMCMHMLTSPHHLPK